MDCHIKGWYSDEYFAYLQELDNVIGVLLSSLTNAGIMDETIIIITGDHGGYEKQHSSERKECMESPIVIYGKSIRQGFEIMDPIVQYDIASTIALILALDIPNSWRGKPILSAFE